MNSINNYNLGFISDEDMYNHVKGTVEKYRFKIDLEDFSQNILDPIKLTFDSKVHKADVLDVLENEIIRQIDKSNTNHIGYFHQNIFKYLGNGWIVPDNGYDIINESKRVYVEMKNKHNTMNSSSSQRTYMRMQATLLNDPAATCMLVEVIASRSQDIVWRTTLDGHSVSNDKIRRVSIDKFYELVTGDRLAFRRLCEALPKVIEDVVNSAPLTDTQNTVIEELLSIDENLLKSIYLLTFKTYEGFNDFNI